MVYCALYSDAKHKTNIECQRKQSVTQDDSIYVPNKVGIFKQNQALNV